jgi:hypothetical protein
LIIGPFCPPKGFVYGFSMAAGGTGFYNTWKSFSVGAGYTYTPTVTIVDPLGTGSGATATATLVGGQITAINMTTGGSNYSSSTYALISAPQGQATGVVTLLANGACAATGVVTNPGSGYATAPTVTVEYISPTGNILINNAYITAGSLGTAIAPSTAAQTSIVFATQPTNAAGSPTVPATGDIVIGPGIPPGVTVSSYTALTATVSSFTAGAGLVVGAPIQFLASGWTAPTATTTINAITGAVATIAVTANSATFNSPPYLVIAEPTGTTQAYSGTLFSETVNGLVGSTAFRVNQAPPIGYGVGSASSLGAYSPLPTIGSVSSTAQLTALFGDISSANPISYACLQALNNSNGTPVYYCVTQPFAYGSASSSVITEEQAYDNALATAAKANTYYGLVPLTFNIAVQQDVAGHVNSLSSPANAAWRTAWFCTALSSSSTAYVQPSFSPTLGYTITTATGSSAEITQYLNGIQSSGANAISSSNPNSGVRRVKNVFPQTYTDGNNNTVYGFYLAAALAGLRSGSVPHQSLTNTQVIGPLAVPIVQNTYTAAQLNQIAGSGVWIVTQSPSGGTCYTRHQLTGDSSNLLYREDSMIANVDSISYGLQNALAPFVGTYNISPGVMLSVRSTIDGILAYYLTQTYTARAGNQLLSYQIVSITQDPTFADQVDIVININIPYPMNYIQLTLNV